MNDVKWIRCLDRLPTKDGRYIVTYRYIDLAIEYITPYENEDLTRQQTCYKYCTTMMEFKNGRWATKEGEVCEIVAWTKFPQPYKGW